MALGMAVVSAGGLVYATKVEPEWLDTIQLDLVLPRLDSAFAGFRLAHITDIHLSEEITGREIAEACDQVLAWKPDLVALTGDFIDKRSQFTRKTQELSAALKNMVQSIPTVAVVGNHDYTMGVKAIRKMLEESQIQELRNEVLSLTRGNAKLSIGGVDDPMNGRARIKEVLAHLPEQGAAILMAHEPDYADISAATGRFDLQISGHTHGGQVALPGIGPLILPHLGQKYPAGLYQVSQMLQYTSRGLGMTDPYIRFNCRPEITLFTLQPGLL
jgi:predicted MPP superfamily phosphohydrolase